MVWRKIAIFDEDGAISVGDGVKFNKLSSAPASPVEGQVYYDDANDRLYLYDGAAWKKILCEGDVTGGTDEKVKTSASDPTAGYLADKLDSAVFEEDIDNWIMKLKDGIAQHIALAANYGIKFKADTGDPSDKDKIIYGDGYTSVGAYYWDGTQWVKAQFNCATLLAESEAVAPRVSASTGLALGNQSADPSGTSYQLARVNHSLKFYDEDDSTWKEVFVGDRAVEQNLFLKGADKVIRWIDAANPNKMLEMFLSNIAGEVGFRFSEDGGNSWSKPSLKNIDILEAEQILALTSLTVSGTSNLMGGATLGGNLDLSENEAVNFAVENVSTLPSTTKSGRVVFNTADNHLYVYVPS